MNIHYGCTRSIAEFHESFARQVEIQVVVRQEDSPQLREILRLVAFQPKHFSRGESGQNSISNLLYRSSLSAKRFHDRFAFRSRAGIAPEFGRANNITIPIQRYESMLLTTNADSRHRRTIQSFKRR